jgi:hypothetical protein
VELGRISRFVAHWPRCSLIAFAIVRSSSMIMILNMVLPPRVYYSANGWRGQKMSCPSKSLLRQL